MTREYRLEELLKYWMEVWEDIEEFIQSDLLYQRAQTLYDTTDHITRRNTEEQDGWTSEQIEEMARRAQHYIKTGELK